MTQTIGRTDRRERNIKLLVAIGEAGRIVHGCPAGVSDFVGTAIGECVEQISARVGQTRTKAIERVLGRNAVFKDGRGETRFVDAITGNNRVADVGDCRLRGQRRREECPCQRAREGGAAREN